MNKKGGFEKVIRVITVAPIMALVMLSILYGVHPGIFHGTSYYILSIIFLTVLPLLAYPLQPFLPKFRNKGREGQRNLAIVMAVLGYLSGIVSAIFFHAPKELLLIYLAYFISGMGVLLFNKVLKIRASGHACGVVGPISILTYFIGIKALISVIAIVPVYWASLKMKRHTISQLFFGGLIPVFTMIILALCTK